MNKASHFYRETRKQILADYQRSPLRLFLQFDCWTYVPPNGSSVQDRGDPEEDDEERLAARWEYDVRASRVPVRVQILHGTPAETVIEVLCGLIAWLDRDAEKLFARGEDVLAERDQEDPLPPL